MNYSVIRKLTPSGQVSTVIDSTTMARSFPNAIVLGGGRMVVGSDDTLYIAIGLNAISPNAIAKVKF
jgi:glucose/arabinose dehydrogenase